MFMLTACLWLAAAIAVVMCPQDYQAVFDTVCGVMKEANNAGVRRDTV
jgi:hypothetical protein